MQTAFAIITKRDRFSWSGLQHCGVETRCVAGCEGFGGGEIGEAGVMGAIRLWGECGAAAKVKVRIAWITNGPVACVAGELKER